MAGGREDRLLDNPRRAAQRPGRVEQKFDPDAVRRLKADAEHDISNDAPELAAQAIRAGFVDEFQMIVCPVVVGGGKRFFPDGVLILRYGVRGAARGLAAGVKSSEIRLA